jgi:uncharacterized protein
MIVGLISDTHGRLRAEVFERFAGVDLILHAGDVGTIDIIIELEAIAPVHAVLGNTDMAALEPRVKEVVVVDLEGHRVVVIHGHQFLSPAPEPLRRAYPDADVIVYGHTHRQRTDWLDGCLIVNPGAAGPARFDLKPSVALLMLNPGETPAIEHISLK